MDFRALLIKVQDRLSDTDRLRLHFLFGDVIPRKLRDDPSISGTLTVLESLFDRGKISEQDFSYLIQAFHEIGCQDAVKRLMAHQLIQQKKNQNSTINFETTVNDNEDDKFVSVPRGWNSEENETLGASHMRQARIPKCATWKSKVTTVAGVFRKEGNSPLHLNEPMGVAIDLDGNLYVSDEKNNRIQRFTLGKKTGMTVAWNLSGPQQLQFDSLTNGLYVSEQYGGRVTKFNVHAGEKVTVVRDCDQCTGAFVSSNGFIYVVEHRRHHVVKYQWDGRSEKNLGIVAGITDTPGSSPEHLSFPQSIFVDDFDNLYVADFGNSRVQKFESNSKHGSTIFHSNRSVPLHLVVDSFGTVYTTVLLQERSGALKSFVIRITTTGSINFIGDTIHLDLEQAEQELEGAHGLVFDKFGNIYVADSGNHRVQRYEIDLRQCH